ncbi:hypothetical protein [Ferrimonas senticii]|uniref:hypothetical protein n=1 Tax=Ferrimonas senticii TaxID=394566 RepID=UPI00040B6B01|nr:hypothetical protein [Ferrimonas senticii]
MPYFHTIDGHWRFNGDPSDLARSRASANQCHQFHADDEDEQVDDVERSCVNCAYRRWHQSGFDCLKPTLDRG